MEDELLEILHANLILLRSSLLVGNPAPNVATTWQAAKNPQPGDLVVESSTLYWPLTASKIGTLLRIVREPFGEDSLPDGREQTQKVYYIRGLDGREYRWENSDFMRIPRDDRDWRDMRGEPQSDGIYSLDDVRRERIGVCRTCGWKLDAGHEPTCPGPA